MRSAVHGLPVTASPERRGIVPRWPRARRDPSSRAHPQPTPHSSHSKGHCDARPHPPALVRLKMLHLLLAPITDPRAPSLPQDQASASSPYRAPHALHGLDVRTALQDSALWCNAPRPKHTTQAQTLWSHRVPTPSLSDVAVTAAQIQQLPASGPLPCPRVHSRQQPRAPKPQYSSSGPLLASGQARTPHCTPPAPMPARLKAKLTPPSHTRPSVLPPCLCLAAPPQPAPPHTRDAAIVTAGPGPP